MRKVHNVSGCWNTLTVNECINLLMYYPILFVNSFMNKNLLFHLQKTISCESVVKQVLDKKLKNARQWVSLWSVRAGRVFICGFISGAEEGGGGIYSPQPESVEITEQLNYGQKTRLKVFVGLFKINRRDTFRLFIPLFPSDSTVKELIYWRGWWEVSFFKTTFVLKT